jgi:sugar lactone lactonase YvrE
MYLALKSINSSTAPYYSSNPISTSADWYALNPGCYASTPPAQITSIAGRSAYRTPVAASSNIGMPWPIALGPGGTVYFGTDFTVYKFDPVTKTIAAVAGTGSAGYAGDGGPAIDAPIGRVTGIQVDSSSNVYFSDTTFCVVRKVTANTGLISTVAGTGVPGYTGDNGLAVAAQLFEPYYLALDPNSTTLYIADSGNGVIRKVSNGVITSVGGTENSWPLGIAVDNAGNLYWIDYLLRKLPAGATVAVTLNSLNMSWNFEGLSIDAAGNLYTADYGTPSIVKFSPTGEATRPYGGGVWGFTADGLPAAGAAMAAPFDVVVDSASNLFFTEGGAHRIREVTGGVLKTLAGVGAADGDLASNFFPVDNLRVGVAADTAGNVYFADTGGRVRKINTAGYLTTIMGTDGDGTTLGDGGLAINATLGEATAIALNQTGDIFIADQPSGTVRKITTNGVVASYATSLRTPSALATDLAGNVYVGGGLCGDWTLQMVNTWITNGAIIQRIAIDGTVTPFAGNGVTGFAGDGGPATSASFSCASGIATDVAGNVYVADTLNHRVRKIDANGVINTVVGNGAIGYSGDGAQAINASLNAPFGLSFDAKGNLYISEFGNNVIRRVTPGGVISTVVGDGSAGFAGDGGAPASAKLNGPTHLSFDGNGNLYIRDAKNGRIRRVSGLTTQ